MDFFWIATQNHSSLLRTSGFLQPLPKIHTSHQYLEDLHWFEAIYKIFVLPVFEAIEVKWRSMLNFEVTTFKICNHSWKFGCQPRKSKAVPKHTQKWGVFWSAVNLPNHIPCSKQFNPRTFHNKCIISLMDFLKVRQSQNNSFQPKFPQKNELTTYYETTGCLRSFFFLRKWKTPKKPFRN